MDRRSFLTTASLAAAGTAAAVALKPVEADAQTANISLIQASTHLQQVVIADAFANIRSGAAWSNAGNATIAAVNSIKAGGFDATMRAYAARFSPANLHQSQMNKTKMVNAIKVYQPAFTLTVLDRYINEVSQAPDQIATAWNQIRTTGVSSLMAQHASRMQLMGAYLNTPVGIAKPTPPHTPPVRIGSGVGVVRPEIPAHPLGPTSNDGRGGGYNCTDDGIAIAAIGTALGVLAFMTAPVSGPAIAGGAIVLGIIEWAGYGMTLWGAGHTVECGF